jgi:hypothetical protein
MRKKTKHMRAYFFILFVCPVVVFAQNQQLPPANGATDCPTFGKKNTSTKAGLFQYMRTNKPPKTEQQVVYRASALPTLKPTTEEEEAIILKKQKRAERAAARKERKFPNEPAPVKTTADEPVIAKAKTDKPDDDKAMTDKPAAAKMDEPVIVKATANKAEVEKEASIENEADAKTTADKRAEERDKKVKKAAFKGKIQHFFKRTNKPSSRKNVQKCPQF